MEKLTDEELYLLLGRLTGTLDAEEAVQAEALLRDHEQARAAYAELSAGYAKRQGEPAWRDIQTVTTRPAQPHYASVRPMTWRRWVAASAIVVLSSVIYLLWKQTNDADSAAARLAAKPGIELRLITGETIDLSAHRGTITVGDIRFANTDNALSYTTGESLGTVGNNTLTVPVGLDYRVTLADGTEIWLNSATRLDFPVAFKGGTRDIRIDGEAYLRVAKDPSRPFFVYLPDSEVEVVGTEFNVNTYDEGTERVALVSGAVRMQARSGDVSSTGPPIEPIALMPGQQATHVPGKPIGVDAFNAREVLSWREGRYHFREATLEEISRVVPRWYGVQVSIDDPSILGRRFTGVIDRNQPIDVFLEDLKAISGIQGKLDVDGTLHFHE